MSGSGMSPILEAVEPLLAALRGHAEAMARDVEPPEAIAQINRVRDAARTYVEAVLDNAGWGNVFADLFEDEEEDDENPDQMPSSGITVLRRADYVVTDEAAVLEAGTAAYRELYPDDPATAASEDVTSLGRALYQVAHLKGWDSLATIPGLRPTAGATVVHNQDSLLTGSPDDWPEDPFDTEGEDLYRQDDVYG